MKIDIKINSKNLDKGQLIILISTFFAFISLFLPWVNAAFVTASSFQMNTFLFMLLYILPVYQVFNRKKFFIDPTPSTSEDAQTCVFEYYSSTMIYFNESYQFIRT